LKNLLTVTAIILFFVEIFYAQTDTFDYFGQKPPGNIPEVFAPGIVSTDLHEHSGPAISPDGKEIYWSSFYNLGTPDFIQKILFVRYENGEWSSPRVAPFSGVYSDGGPCFTKDGNRLYFYSERPLPDQGGELKDDIWYVDRNDEGWSNPQNMGYSHISKQEKWIFSPSIADNGNIYITGPLNGHGIFIIKKQRDGYLEPEALGSAINSNYDNFNWTPFIAPDESYLIFSSKRINNKGFNDLYISFSDNGEWTTPINMGQEINNGKQVRFPVVSGDGKYIFFTRERNSGDDDIFWVDSKIIDSLKPTGIDAKPGTQPNKIKLNQNFPNPFNTLTHVQYTLYKASQVKLLIYNMLGQKIKTLVHNRQESGNYKTSWDAANDNNISVCSGIYVCKLEFDGYMLAKKMLYLK
jgi:hypothetical protein